MPAYVALLGLHDRALFGAVDLTNGKTPAMMLWIERHFDKEITTRTWKTVGRILQKL